MFKIWGQFHCHNCDWIHALAYILFNNQLIDNLSRLWYMYTFLNDLFFQFGMIFLYWVFQSWHKVTCCCILRTHNKPVTLGVNGVNNTQASSAITAVTSYCPLNDHPVFDMNVMKSNLIPLKVIDLKITIFFFDFII